MRPPCRPQRTRGCLRALKAFPELVFRSTFLLGHPGFAWAARRAGVAATIVMANDAYPNKIAACREQGAEVILTESLQEAEDVCGRLVAGGRTLVHPYDARGTVEGAGTVGLEIAEDWQTADKRYVVFDDEDGVSSPVK